MKIYGIKITPLYKKIVVIKEIYHIVYGGGFMSHNIREIYTKAIVAKGKKLSRNTYNFSLNHFPDDVLGCWITNHHFEAAIKNKIPKIVGTFDVHIWYSYHDEMDSIVEKHQVTYIDDMQVTKKSSEFESNDQVKGRCLEKPKCLTATHSNQEVTIEIEKEMQIEISGETCIKVEVKDEEEIWDDLEDIEINPHFIKG